MVLIHGLASCALRGKTYGFGDLGERGVGRGSLNYLFGGNPTIQIYSKFDGFPS